MLLDLIEHQEELFAAIIAPLNYGCLSALRAACKALFTTISGAHRWQHMRNFAAPLRQINSIQRVTVCDDRGIQTTIIHHNNYNTFYRIGMASGLEIYCDSNSKNRHYILRDMIVESPTKMRIYRIKNNPKVIPEWLSNCILPIKTNHYEIIIDLR
jgi:hypothetical protein